MPSKRGSRPPDGANGIPVLLHSRCWSVIARSTDLYHALRGKARKLSFVLDPIRENTRDGRLVCLVLTGSSSHLTTHSGSAVSLE